MDKKFPVPSFKSPKLEKRPTFYPPVSPTNSIGQDIYRYSASIRKMLIFLFVLFGVILGFIVGVLNDSPVAFFLAAAFFGFIGWILGTLFSDYVTLFLDAKAELLINTAKIQEDLDFLCKVKENEMAAAQNAAPPSDHY